MDHTLKSVVIAGTGSFLPNEPVPSGEIDRILGPLDQAPPRVRAFMAKVGSRLLAESGIEHRHFAVDPETRNLTHTVAALAEQACRQALNAAGKQPEEVQLLVLSSPNYDASSPPTSTFLQERLGIERCTEMEIHSNCTGVAKSMQVAYDALRVGRYKTAMVVYSQLSSSYLRSSYFNQAVMTKTQAALRYILADGSGAVLLQGVDASKGGPLRHEMIGTHVESVGGRRPASMTAGAGAMNLVEYDRQVPEMYAQGWHHLDQDFATVGRDSGPILLEGMVRMTETLGLDRRSINHIVASVATRQLYDQHIGPFLDTFGVTRDQARFWAAKTGYCGGASLLIHFDLMARGNVLRQGDIVLVAAVESSKWMTGGFVVRW